jgi:hypothetical protein
MNDTRRNQSVVSSRKAALLAASGVERRPPPIDEIAGRSRKGRKGVVVYLHPVAKDLLVRLAREQRKTIQDLGLEAINLLFKQYGEKPLA